ncbi:MAG: VOC family protein [Bacteroidota bacterium]
MQQHLARIALVVKDYDEAIAYYTEKLQFTLIEDTPRSPTKRWVVVAPPGSPTRGCAFILAKAAKPEQEAAIGHQSGGRVFLFLHTDDFWRDYEYMKAKGVDFTEEPREEEYGTVVVFRDLYGNKWDFIQPR